MAYIGNKIPANFQSLPAVQRFNGTGSATAFTLASVVANDQSILVSVDGVTQDSNAYAVSGTTLTFTAAPSAGTGNVFVHTISPVGSTVVPPDGLAITATTGTFSGALSTIAGTITTASNEEDALLIEQADGTDVGSLRINNGSFIIKGKNASSPVQIQTHDGNEDIEVDPDGFIKMETAGSERLRIDSSGNIGIGVVPESSYPARPVLRIGSGLGLMCRASGNPSHTWINSNCYQDPSSADDKYIGTDEASQINQANGIFNFNVAPSGSANAAITWNTAMRIASDGDVSIGGTTATAAFNLVGTGGSNVQIQNNINSGTNTIVSIGFINDNGLIGSIQCGGSSTSYATSSDYRMKENVDYTWDATTRLKQLKPARFNFIADDTNTLIDGFIAHEVSSIVPEAVTGAKDAMTAQVLYAEGDVLPEGKSVGDVKQPSVIDPQGIDQSKLVPLLVKTIQELEARLTAGGL